MKTKAIVRRESGDDELAFELPAYAVRYLHQMCQRERNMLDNLAMSGIYSVAVDAARDALKQIERAITAG